MILVIQTVEVDRASVGRFRAELAAGVATFLAEVGRDGPVHLRIDLRNVTFMDASGVHALLDAERDVGCLEVHAAGIVRRVLEVTDVWPRLGSRTALVGP